MLEFCFLKINIANNQHCEKCFENRIDAMASTQVERMLVDNKKNIPWLRKSNLEN